MAGVTLPPPYAAMLGIVVEAGADGAGSVSAPTLLMPPGEALLGRPGFLHGGTLAAVLEQAGTAAARQAIDDPAAVLVLIGMTIDYLRGAVLAETRARGRIVRVGKRIAAVEAVAWQDDPARPIAMARINLSIERQAGG